MTENITIATGKSYNSHYHSLAGVSAGTTSLSFAATPLFWATQMRVNWNHYREETCKWVQKCTINIKQSHAPVSRWSSRHSISDNPIVSTIPSSCDLTTIWLRESDWKQMSSKEPTTKLKRGFQINRKSKLVGFTVSSREDLERKIVSCYRFVFSCSILSDEKHVNRLVFSSPLSFTSWLFRLRLRSIAKPPGYSSDAQPLGLSLIIKLR